MNQAEKLWNKESVDMCDKLRKEDSCVSIGEWSLVVATSSITASTSTATATNSTSLATRATAGPTTYRAHWASVRMYALVFILGTRGRCKQCLTMFSMYENSNNSMQTFNVIQMVIHVNTLLYCKFLYYPIIETSNLTYRQHLNINVTIKLQVQMYYYSGLVKHSFNHQLILLQTNNTHFVQWVYNNHYTKRVIPI